MAPIKREILTSHKVLYNIVFASFFWIYHTNSITSRANKTLGLLCRNLNSCSPYIKNVAYKPLVRPQLEYCSQIWDPYEKGDILSPEKVQRRPARFVSGDYRRESSVTNMICNISWQVGSHLRSIGR